MGSLRSISKIFSELSQYSDVYIRGSLCQVIDSEHVEVFCFVNRLVEEGNEKIGSLRYGDLVLLLEDDPRQLLGTRFVSALTRCGACFILVDHIQIIE